MQVTTPRTMHALHVLTHRMWFDERLQCVPWAVLVPVDQLQQRPGLQSGVELWVQHFARDVIRERITQRFQRRGVSYPRGSGGVGPCVDEQLRHAIVHTRTHTHTHARFRLNVSQRTSMPRKDFALRNELRPETPLPTTSRWSEEVAVALRTRDSHQTNPHGACLCCIRQPYTCGKVQKG